MDNYKNEINDLKNKLSNLEKKINGGNFFMH